MAALPPITQLAGNHRALFEGYWTLVDQTGSGAVPASIAAEFLKKSQLRESVLHKIWSLSDPKASGCLDKQGFFLSLRLVGACQVGKEPGVANIALTDPPPRFNGIDPASLDGRGKWTIDKEEQARYEQLFQSLKPTNGLLPGDKAKPFMLQSKLPVDVLGKVWSLSDIDKDGKLDKEEFSVAMKLISLAQSGETLPPALPPSLVPPSKVKKGGVASPAVGVAMIPTSVGNSPSPHTSIPGSPVPAKKTEWVVTPELQNKYNSYFQGIDTDHDGFVTGEQARSLFMASSLPQAQLAHVWGLCDIQKTGRLNAEQFALAMFIIAEKVRGKELPTELTPAMIPPSLRKLATPPNNTPTHSVAASSSVWATSDLAWSSTPSLSVAMATSVADTSTAWSSPAPQTSEPAPEEFSGGFGSDFSAIKDLDTVAKEVDSIKKEKVQLSEAIKSKQELIQQRKAEVESLQSDAESSVHQRERLEKERLEAQSRLDELEREKSRVDTEVAELRSKCEEELKEIERLKESLTTQETSKKSQAEELEKLRVQLEALKKEEREYKEKVEASASELDKLQKANQNIQAQISQTRQKIDNYKEEHHTLTNTLSMYPPGSTPSSTRSSSANISDMALHHLPSELTVPHISEPDAISARATAGSSSPVSSISGFSTNSHLDEGAEDSSVGSAVKVEDKRTVDPFSSTQSSSDPFAAFALPPGDPFASAQGFKPSNLSAFDPFGTSDPFKTTSSAPPVDLFKDDPFGVVAASKASAPPTSSGGGTDPFSGQDPFSSDPFASSDRKDNDQPGWGAFSVDPFASQSSSTDPFSSSDPFGDDPFSRQSSTGAENVFQQQPSQSSKDITIPEALPKPGPLTSNAERLRWAQRESEREEALRKKRQLEEEEAIAKAIRDSIKNSN